VPTAADASLLTDLLRERWGFDGTVVADYFSVGFLASLHGIIAEGDWGGAAVAALSAGIDVELPTVRGYGAPLAEEVRAGRVDEALVDRALRRVLAQKIGLGLLDPGWSPVPEALQATDAPADSSAAESLRGTIDLDSAGNRQLASRLAEQAVVLLSNDGTLPLSAPRRIAVVGPTASDPYAVLGCYSFPSHVGVQHPEVPDGIRLPTLLHSLREEFSSSTVTHAPGTTIDGGETDGIDAAVAAAAEADVVIVALGDRAGLFGRGTSGEGCDAESLANPGAQQQMLDAVLATGTPVIVVLMAGRPYALGAAPASAAAIIEAFFLGERGAPAIAGVLSGRVNPSGRLPVSVPATPGSQPTSYLASTLARRSGVSNIDPTPAYPFGHGLSYSRIEWADGGVSATQFDDTVEVAVRLSNASDRDGAEVVQLYLHDPVASVVRPTQRLISYARVELAAGADAMVTFTVPAELASFTGVSGERIVEPGELVLGVARSSGDIVFSHTVSLTGATRVVDHTRPLHALVDITS
jgi:beta-xylosidase